MPLILPILNDKIVIRIWSNINWGADILLANVPEKPMDSDPFNITKLMNNENKMTTRWINLYGTPPNDWPGWFGSSTMETYLEGASYLGRILISMYINATENPKMSK